MVCELCLVAQSCPALYNPMDCSLPGPSVLGASPGKNTGLGCHALLQGIFPTQGSNPHPFTSPALAGGFFFFFFLPLAPPWNPQKDPRAGVGEGALGRGVPQGRLCQVKEQQEQDLVRSE